jgi:hypothetical protein
MGREEKYVWLTTRQIRKLYHNALHVNKSIDYIPYQETENKQLMWELATDTETDPLVHFRRYSSSLVTSIVYGYDRSLSSWSTPCQSNLPGGKYKSKRPMTDSTTVSAGPPSTRPSTKNSSTTSTTTSASTRPAAPPSQTSIPSCASSPPGSAPPNARPWRTTTPR